MKAAHLLNLLPEGLLAFLLCPSLASRPLVTPLSSHTIGSRTPYLVSTETEGEVMEIFQPFGSEAWPSSQRDGVFQSREVVV